MKSPHINVQNVHVYKGNVWSGGATLHTADGCIQIGARLPDPVSRVPALSPPPIDPRSVLGRVAALTWRQPTGVLVLCSAASTALSLES